MHNVVAEQTLGAKVRSDEAPALRSNHAMVVGLGNIGSQVVPLLAPKIDSIRLVDRDVVEAHNVENQCYARGDIGRNKVDIFAERLRDAHPHLQVDRFVGELQDMPWGEFADVDVVLAGLDSLSARQSLAEILYPLQVPYIDGAVGDPFDVRVQVLLPGSACLECSWGKGQYRQLHTETPCRPGAATDTPRTLAPAAAGAATAALMVAQSQKVLSESPPTESYEINGDLLAGRVTTSRRRRNANCRFSHAGRPGEVCLRKRFDVATVGDLLSVVPQSNGSQPLQLEFRRGILGANLFSDDRLATVEQLDSVRDNRLADMGLTARDRIVARHGDSQDAKVTHIAMTADNHPQVSE